MKDAITIAIITVMIICGAITGIVGGALGMSVTAALLHFAIGS